MFPFDPPENIRKLLGFWCFQRDQKGKLGRKGLNGWNTRGRISRHVELLDGSQCLLLDLGNFINYVKNFQAPFWARFVTPKELVLNETSQKYYTKQYLFEMQLPFRLVKFYKDTTWFLNKKRFHIFRKYLKKTTLQQKFTAKSLLLLLQTTLT